VANDLQNQAAQPKKQARNNFYTWLKYGDKSPHKDTGENNLYSVMGWRKKKKKKKVDNE